MTTATSSAANLVRSLRGRGFALRLDAGQIMVSPSDRLTPADRAAILGQRDGVVALLAGEGDPAESVLYLRGMAADLKARAAALAGQADARLGPTVARRWRLRLRRLALDLDALADQLSRERAPR